MWREHPPTASWEPSQEQQQPSVIQPPIPAPQPGVAWLPPVADDRGNFGIIAAGFFAFALFLIVQTIASFGDSHSALLPRLAALLFSFLLPGALIPLGVKVNKQSRRWDKVNQRRQMAAALGFTPDVPLAEPQPLPNLGALPLHATIKLKINWVGWCIRACLIAAIPFLAWVWLMLSLALLYGDPVQRSLENGLHAWFLLAIWGPVVLAQYVIRSFPQRIEVTPEGLAVKHTFYDWASSKAQNKKQLIRWHEARLFAIRGGKPGGATVRYELSGPFTAVTFERILRPRWWARFRPAQPFGEYNAQMNALLAYITAHTGLLLYDLRQQE